MARGAALTVFSIVASALIIGLWVILSNSGLTFLSATGWTICALFILLWFFCVIEVFPKKLGVIFLVLAGMTGILLVFGAKGILQEAVPSCGDGICGIGECEEECSDCKPADCTDGICQLDVEQCDTSPDCECPSGTSCAPHRAEANQQGCYFIRCGDTFCDSTENSTACCTDCGCDPGFECSFNSCYFLTPKLTFTSYLYSDDISVTTLAANPSLQNGTGVIYPFMAITLKNRVSAAIDLRVHFTLGDLLAKEVKIGTFGSGATKDVFWYLEHEPSLLDLTEDFSTNITVRLQYYDVQNIGHNASWNFPVIVRSRNTLDKHGNLVYFVTPDDVNVQGIGANGIWQRMHSDVSLGPDSEFVQFPAETLEKGEGSARDIAILLASAYHASGIRSSLVESDYGTFVRVWEDREYTIIDPAKWDESFSDAEAGKPGYAVYDLEETWRELNLTVLSLG